jgi:putative ABC transport system permease protein
LLIAWKALWETGFAHYPFGNLEIEAVADASRLLERVAGVDANGPGRNVLREGAASTQVGVALVTGEFFAVLGVEPVLGRAITRDDDRDGAEHVLVLSHRFWRRHYAGAPDVIGRRIRLGDQPFTIVGVMPPDVEYPSGVEAWRTTRSVPTSGPFGDAARREIDLVARMKPGVTPEQAASELAALTKQWEATQPGVTRGLTPVVQTFANVVVGPVRSVLVALVAAVALVLLIATANVANLLSMRGEARRAELAVRAALGAGRGRLVRQVVAESLGLTLVAAVASLVLARWSLATLVALVPDGLPRVDAIRIDVVVLLGGAALALVTACLASLAPVLSTLRLDLVAQLRSGGRGGTRANAANGRRLLVVAQIALAVTVVAAAGLLARSLLRLQTIDVGLAADRLVFLDLFLPQDRYADSARHAALLDAIIASLESVPLVAAATPVNSAPFSGEGGWDVPRFTADGQSAERAAVNPSLNFEVIHDNYFETFRIPIVRGRAFTAADREGTLPVAIVSADVAAQTWPGQDPIGRRIRIGGPTSRDPWRTVVGVAAPTRYRELARIRPTLYLLDRQLLIAATRMVIRTTAPVEVVASTARERIRAIDPDVPVTRVATFAELLGAPLARPRFNAFFLSVFAAVALLLAAVGVYAVMAVWVRQRDREIGVRVALGATPARVRRLVLGEGLQLAAAGAAIGLVGAIVTTRLVRGLVVDVDPLDPASLLGAVLLLIVAASLASALPLRRALRIDPVAMLRSE